MRTLTLAIATGAVVALFNVGAAQAQNYPYCLKMGPGPGNCMYSTYQQCQATASGTGYYCQPNYALRSSRAYARHGRSRAYRAYGQQY